MLGSQPKGARHAENLNDIRNIASDINNTYAYVHHILINKYRQGAVGQLASHASHLMHKFGQLDAEIHASRYLPMMKLPIPMAPMY